MNKHEKIVETFVKKFFKRVYGAIQSQIDSFIRDLKYDGLEEAKRSLHGVIGSNKVANAVKELWITGALFFAKQTSNDIIETKAGFGFNERWTNDIIQFLRDYLLVKAVIPISETTKKQILAVLDKGQQEGWGIGQIVKELEDSDITKDRARMIIRTELAMAMWKGQELAIRDSQWLTEETWIATRDLRTRHSHMVMNGVKIDTGEKFKVPVYKKIGKVEIQIGFDLMSGPGDPSASAGNIINCRCTKVVRAKRLNGNLIPKTGIQITTKF